MKDPILQEAFLNILDTFSNGNIVKFVHFKCYLENLCEKEPPEAQQLKDIVIKLSRFIDAVQPK